MNQQEYTEKVNQIMKKVEDLPKEDQEKIYNLYEETNKRYNKIRINYLNIQIGLSKLEVLSKERLSDLDTLKLRTILIAFDLEETLKGK